MVCEPGSSALMHLRDDASAAQRAANVSGLVLHALVVLPHPENRLAIGQGDAHAILARALERVPAVVEAIAGGSATLESFAPAMDIAAMSQQYLHSRLFRS